MKTDTKLLLETLLGDDHCLIHVNPSISGVIVPDHLRKEPTISFKLSHYFAGSVVLREDKVEAELRFGSSPVNCHFPYKSIWAVASITGELTIWEDRALHPSLPKLLKESMSIPPAVTPVAVPVKPALSGISGAVSSQEGHDAEAQEKPGAEKKRPSFLKRVK